MKIITFNKLSIRNFLSIGNDPIIIDFKEGVNFITGENIDVPGTKNGLGKSSIADAFNFALFGDSLRKLTKDQICNNLTNSITQVILEFNCNSPKGNNNFVITRELNPSRLTVEKDGRDKTRDSIPNTTKYILEVISGSQEVFKNCIIMRANNTIPFMAQGKIDKKKFIENIFNLDIITKMSKLVKDDININKQDLDVESKLFAQLEHYLNNYNNTLEKESKLIIEHKEKFKKTKEDLTQKIINLEESNKNLTKELSEHSKTEDLECKAKESLDKANSLIIDWNTKLGINLNNQNVQLIALEGIKKFGAVCKECKRPFEKDDIEHANKERERISLELNELKSKEVKIREIINLTSKATNKARFEYNAILDSNRKYHSNETKIINNNNLIKSYQDNLKSLDDNSDLSNSSRLSVLSDLIKNTTLDKETKETKITEINKKLSELEVARFVLSEEGIRSYIIKKLLDLLNFRIKYYLAKQNSQYSLVFDDVFNDVIENKRGIPVSYGNLSGAESKMLDLACIWAFRDILKLQGSVSYNIAFYDEILDSSMDSKNSEIVCNILNEFGTNEKQAIYLISHKTDFLKAVSGEVIYLEKKNGITSRITL